MNEATATVIDEAKNPDARIVIPFQDIPERYKNRLEKAKGRPMIHLLRLMGLEENDQGLSVPSNGIRTRLEAAGISPQFDLVIADGVVTPKDYLKLIVADGAPLSNGSPATALHDFMFHGFGFESMDTPLGDLTKHTGERILQSERPELIEKCVNVIDGFSGAYFVTSLDDEFSLEEALSEGIKEMATLLGTPLTGESMIEQRSAQQYAQQVSASADSIAQASAAHFSNVLQLANTTVQ